MKSKANNETKAYDIKGWESQLVRRLHNIERHYHDSIVFRQK